MKDVERERAERLARSAAGAAMDGDVKAGAREAAKATKSFIPGEGRSAKESFVVSFTPEQKELIKAMIGNASTPMEIERIEDCVKRGEFPQLNENKENSEKLNQNECNSHEESKKIEINSQ